MNAFQRICNRASTCAALALVCWLSLAGAAAADEVVNADHIVILSDDVRKTSTGVVHSGSAATSDPAAGPASEGASPPAEAAVPTD